MGMACDFNRSRQAPSPRRGQPPTYFVDERWLARRDEGVLEAGLPIVDAHHHLWHRASRYLAPELVADMRSGHDIRATVFVEAGFAYRKDGAPEMACLGEVEYANGVGALGASGYHGALRPCAAIVGRADLTLGARVEPVLTASMQCAPGRYRGVRHIVATDSSPGVTQPQRPPPADLMLERNFREGFAVLGKLGLSFDSYCYHPQLPQLLDLADNFPETSIIVNHCGGLIGEGPYAQRRQEEFKQWRDCILALAQRPNVVMKIGGLSGRIAGHTFIDRLKPPSSFELANAWRPVVQTCIEAFGPDRVMFESNFPVDKCAVSYRILWNAFKRIARNFSADEKAAMFAKTAVRAYRLPTSLLAMA